MNQWISVKDGLPPKNKNVLVFSNRGKIDIGFVCPRTGEFDTFQLEAFWLMEQNESAAYTHWMPLPEPPTE